MDLSATQKFLRALAIAAVIMLVLWNLDIGTFLQHLQRDLLVAIVAVQPFLLGALSASAFRHSVLARTPKTPFVPAFKAIILFTGLNYLLPARLAEIVKATYLRNHLGVPLSNGVTAIIFGHLFDLIGVGFLAVSALPIVVGDLGQRGWMISSGLMIAAAGILFIFPRFDLHLRSMADRIPWMTARNFVLKSVVHAQSRYTKKTFRLCIASTIANVVLSVLTVACVLYFAGNTPPTVKVILLFYLSSIVGGMIPIMPAGLGTVETAVTATLIALGYGFDEALALAIVFRLANVLPVATLGVFIASQERVGISRLLRDIKDAVREGRKVPPENTNSE